MSLRDLICGKSDGTSGVANLTLEHLGNSLDRFGAKSLKHLNGKFNDEAQNFGAFTTRVVLENACAALVGRLDPFRLLYLAQFQSQPTFEYGRPTKSGFRWQGDVMPDDKAPPPDLWGAEHDFSKVSRALFSTYAARIHWEPAFERMLDAIATEDSQPFEDLLLIDPQSFVGQVRGRCSALYSTLSKGVHWDFFVATVVLDEGTIRDTIRETLISLGNLGLVSHFVPTAFRSLDNKKALKAYKKFRSGFS